LSYCWGQEKAICKININGHPFYVRPNLFAYLQLLSQEEDSTCIFIDAICINQDDLAEKSIQIGLMGDVYRLAIECVAWLGCDGGENDDSINIGTSYAILFRWR
jgi:hypothetical protein